LGFPTHKNHTKFGFGIEIRNERRIIMRVVKKGFVIYNTKIKTFEDLDDCTHYLENAYIYESRSDVEESIQSYDKPEIMEVWEVEKTINTI